jgi:type III secretory pathway component EscT
MSAAGMLAKGSSDMAERILFAISVALAILAASFSAGIIRQGAQNVNQLFHGVPAAQEEGN